MAAKLPPLKLTNDLNANKSIRHYSKELVMTVIDERTAWKILNKYVRDCLEIDPNSLVAVYAIGSLPGGYYRPGQSDIDAVLIVANDSEYFWGDINTLSTPLDALNRKYLENYQIPKNFGPFPLRTGDLYPPYDQEADLLTLEIARLKVQSSCIFGQFDLESVPLPTADDFLRDEGRFEAWWRDEFSKEMPFEAMSTTACVNTVLIHLGRFLRIRKGILEFNKYKLIPCYLDNDTPFVNQDVYQLISAYLEGTLPTTSEGRQLQKYTSQLRTRMNEHLGINGYM